MIINEVYTLTVHNEHGTVVAIRRTCHGCDGPVVGASSWDISDDKVAAESELGDGSRDSSRGCGSSSRGLSIANAKESGKCADDGGTWEKHV